MCNPLLVLQLAVHFEQTRLDEGAALLTADALPDDDIHLAALVLQGEESDAARGRRALAHEHDAGGAHAAELAAGRSAAARSRSRNSANGCLPSVSPSDA